MLLGAKLSLFPIAISTLLHTPCIVLTISGTMSLHHLSRTAVERESLSIDPLTLLARQEAHHTSDVNWIAVTNQWRSMRGHLCGISDHLQSSKRGLALTSSSC